MWRKPPSKALSKVPTVRAALADIPCQSGSRFDKPVLSSIEGLSRNGLVQRFLGLCLLSLLAACASFGPQLIPGTSDRAAVLAALGTPAMTWRNDDGGEQLAYPTGPAGTQTTMAYLGADGKLQRLDKVLRPEVLAQIKPGLSETEVLRLIGPPQPRWTVYFKSRDERVWEWRYCNEWSQTARFDVLFDGTSHRVRSTLARPEYLIPINGMAEGDGAWCAP